MDIDKKIEEFETKKNRLKVMKTWDKRAKDLAAKGVNQEQLCAEADVDVTHFCHLKSGKRTSITKETFDKIENALIARGV